MTTKRLCLSTFTTRYQITLHIKAIKYYWTYEDRTRILPALESLVVILGSYFSQDAPWSTLYSVGSPGNTVFISRIEFLNLWIKYVRRDYSNFFRMFCQDKKSKKLLLVFLSIEYNEFATLIIQYSPWPSGSINIVL